MLMRYLVLFLCTISISLLSSYTLWSQQYEGPKEDIESILAIGKHFSELYVQGAHVALSNYYTTDGKLIPERIDIIMGREAIAERWASQKGRKILFHEMVPKEIKVLQDHAYDYGYYRGQTRNANGDTNSWQGKYTIIWKKINTDWKIYLDIWNSLD